MLRLLKFTLDLFDVAPVYKPKPEPKPKRALPKKPSLPQTPLLPTFLHTEDVFSHHPEASQQTQLSGHVVNYELLRSRRRTMTFSVSSAGLSVRAPYGMPQHSIEAAVQEKGRWIVRKLSGMQQREKQLAALKLNWQAGATLAYLSGTLRVEVDPHVKATTLTTAADGGKAWVLSLALPLGLNVGSSDKKIRDATKKWMAQQAIQYFTERLNHYAPLLRVQWKSLALTNASTRWGSAKADGSIRLHWRLMQFSPDVIDYVVVHELSHLRQLNHSPRFWAIVASILPDYQARQQQLKSQVLPVWE